MLTDRSNQNDMRPNGRRQGQQGVQGTRSDGSGGGAVQSLQDGNIQTRFDFISQLEERRQGNEKYKSRDLDGALHHYERALAIVDYVRGVSPAEQVMPAHALPNFWDRTGVDLSCRVPGF